ncbi:HAD-IA family hydrolase [Glycomyces salinus]|uniref:HAD-IA family hydrolase n=1 Tax=Glycomyces salinus TaxID=980294 RepID=UPI0018EBF416|nr:HAD-IA family hydrolase [Glycomyces salinus]
MPNGIRVIIADIGSVLFTFDPEHRFELLSERTGLGRDELNRLLFTPPTEADEAFETRCEAGEFTPDQIRDRVADLTGFDGGTEELSRLWTSAFTVDQAVLDALTEPDIPLAIFSNNGPLFADYFDQRFPETAAWFLHRYFACRLRARKPDPAAYEAVEEHLERALDARPHQLLFIDDNRRNTAAAAARGWQVHTYATPKILRDILAATA